MSESDKVLLKEYQTQYSCLYRFTYNRHKDKLSQKEIRESHLVMNHIELLDSWFKQSAIYDTKSIAIDKKVIFGGKRNYLLRSNGKITKEQYNQNRLLPIYSVGESPQFGNRKFKLDIISNNQVIFKPSKGIKLIINLPKLRTNYKALLFNMQFRAEQKQIPVSIKLDQEYVYFIFEESVSSKSETKPNKFSGIDMNPNYISLVLGDNKEFLFNLSKITDKSNYNHNKLKHETIEITKLISDILFKNHITHVGLENLSIPTSNKNKGTRFNRLCNNVWLRRLFVTQLKKRCKLLHIKVVDIHPAYSSFIGNLIYKKPDAISSAYELMRRCTEVINQTKWNYPELISNEDLSNLWKKDINWSYSSWKELFGLVKNSKLRYRVSMEDIVFQKFKSNKSNIGLYQ